MTDPHYQAELADPNNPLREIRENQAPGQTTVTNLPEERIPGAPAPLKRRVRR